MNTWIWIALYLAGVALAYPILKKITKTGTWTKGDRIQTFGLAIFSWIAVMVSFLKWVNEYEDDRPAKW